MGSLFQRVRVKEESLKNQSLMYHVYLGSFLTTKENDSGKYGKVETFHSEGPLFSLICTFTYAIIVLNMPVFVGQHYVIWGVEK